MPELKVTPADFDDVATERILDDELDSVEALTSIKSFDQFCDAYWDRFYVPLRKIRNTLDKRIVKILVGKKPYRTVARLMNLIEGFCPRPSDK